MSTTIPVHQLEDAVKKAITNHKIGQGPIVIGFISPDKIDDAAAKRVAEEVSSHLGIGGKAANLALTPGHLNQGGHIIIGLIATNRAD